MERKEKEVLLRIEDEISRSFEFLVNCEDVDLAKAFKSMTESVQEYCTFRTLLGKYSGKEEVDSKDGIL